MKWFIKCLKNYATFKGRARLKEYWMFTLIYMMILFILGILMGITGPETYFDEQTYSMVTAESGTTYIIISILFTIFSLATVLPAIAVTVRRLHDTGKSGWWYFINFIPFIGAFILLVFLVLDGEVNENQYGPNPKTIE